jgi:hypothetical protein
MPIATQFNWTDLTSSSKRHRSEQEGSDQINLQQIELLSLSILSIYPDLI